MPKWDTKDAPRGRKFNVYTCSTKKRRFKEPKAPRYPNGINHTFKLYEKKDTKLSKISQDEREFFRTWSTSRNIEDQYCLLALTYWMRIRAALAVMFLVKDKRLYMIACIHAAMKWLGYDEVYKCDFIKDLREISNISTQDHIDLEFEILRELSWEL